MTFSGGFCVFFSLMSMIMDIRWEKVSNRWILFGWLAAAAWQTCGKGPEGVLFFLAGALFPIGLLFPLFASKMLGTGDIKLFSALGIWLGADSVLMCMFWSFIAALIMAVFILIINRTLKIRLRYLKNYFRRFFGSGIKTDYEIQRAGKARIHISIPVLVGVILKVVGVYA